jgi:hypothetical protein
MNSQIAKGVATSTAAVTSVVCSKLRKIGILILMLGARLTFVLTTQDKGTDGIKQP